MKAQMSRWNQRDVVAAESTKLLEICFPDQGRERRMGAYGEVEGHVNACIYQRNLFQPEFISIIYPAPPPSSIFPQLYKECGVPCLTK
jgi:hypothetical protein